MISQSQLTVAVLLAPLLVCCCLPFVGSLTLQFPAPLSQLHSNWALRGRELQAMLLVLVVSSPCDPYRHSQTIPLTCNFHLMSTFKVQGTVLLPANTVADEI